ncbi:MAG: hypothetical protein AAF492_31145, partial [Verrucomicrobiota bacterium]
MNATKSPDSMTSGDRAAEESNSFDAFLSYRRRDGALIALWLRHQLKKYRLPRPLREKYNPDARPLRIWFDRVQMFADKDYFNTQIRPALRSAHCLIVLSTPSVYKASSEEREDGFLNWVEREISEFRSFAPSRPLIVAQTEPGEFPGRVPGPLE